MIVKELFAKLGLDVDEGAFSAAEAAMGAVKGGLAAVGVALGGMAVGFAAMVRSTSNAGDNLDELSARTGVNTDALQRLGYAASFSSIGLDELAVAMNYLAKKGSKDVEKDLGKIADRVKALTDQGRGAEAAAYAIEKLGKRGGAMVPFLKEGSAAIKSMGDEAEQLGFIMDKETIKASADFNDSIDRIGHAWTGLRNSVIGPLLPALTKVSKAVLEWFKANRELIKQRLNQAITVLFTAVKVLWAVLSGMAKTIGFLIDNWKLLATIVGGIALAALLANAGAAAQAVAWYVALGAASVVAGAKAALAWLAAAAPVTLIGLLIAALVLGIQDFYTFLKGGDSLIGDLFKRWKNFVFSLTDPSKGDTWFVKQLKEGIRLFEVLTQLARHFFFPSSTQQNADGSEQGTTDRMFNFARRAVLVSGGASPEAVDALERPRVSRGGGSTSVMNVGGVTVNVPSGDPKEVKSAVVSAFEDMWRGKMGASFVAVDQ